jgi:ATP-binding cassette subfamily F protein uup
MSFLFSLKNISKSYGDDTLFTGLSIDFKPYEQLGLIGMNGSGKSTLLKIIAGQTDPDQGEVITQKGLRFIYLPQEDCLNPEYTIEQVLYNETKKFGFDDKHQHKIIRKALGQGNFPDISIHVKSLSGGWKKKLAITCALCCQPDVLLLDEPTNHLDIKGILWLENILKNAGFSFICVSHDRAFLENICRNTMEIGKFYPDGYFRINGSYRKFKKEKEKFLAARQKQQSSLKTRVKREEQWLSQGPKARTTKAKYRIEQAKQLKAQLQILKTQNRICAAPEMDFTATGRQTKKLLRAFNLKKSMGTRILFSDLSFEMGPGFCLGIAGDNGSGKSTLMSILEKKIQPDEGKVEWAQELKTAVFDQTRSALEPEMPLKQALNPAGGDSVNYRGRSIHIVSWAKQFLFMPDQLEMPVKNLSGGEKARILIANLMLSPCDILFLDEPANDLDIISLEVLEDSIRKFAGAVVIVSHDRYLMDRVCNTILYLDPESSGTFFKDFSQIIKFRQALHNKSGKTPKNHKPKQKKKKSSGKIFSYKDKYELDHIEDKISNAEKLVNLLTDKIQLPEIINNPEKMSLHCSELKQAQEKLDALYERWEELEKKKSEASG